MSLFGVSFIPQEKDARDIEIPNIKWEVFELMMRYDELLQASSWLTRDIKISKSL